MREPRRDRVLALRTPLTLVAGVVQDLADADVQPNAVAIPTGMSESYGEPASLCPQNPTTSVMGLAQELSTHALRVEFPSGGFSIILNV